MTTATISWEQALPELLEELSAVQHEWLVVLAEKQRLLLDPATEADVAVLQSREAELLARLQACHDRREELLRLAESEGKPGKSLRAVAATLPAGAGRETVEARLDEAQRQSRLLRQRNLANWMMHQRAMIHLSQVLEILATGGRLQPTYENGKLSSNGPTGILVDEAV
jgi:flagellar biosynthesis/type III secretory pathway chaperone